MVRFALTVTLLCLSWPGTGHAQNSPAARRSAIELMYPVMVKALATENFGQARNICDQAIIWEPDNPIHYYNLACIEARAGNGRLAAAWLALERAVELGFDEVDTLRRDPDLSPLRDGAKFSLLEQRVMRNSAAPVRPAGAGIHPGASDGGAGTAATGEAVPQAGEPGLARPLNLDVLAHGELPAAVGMRKGVPVGLYFMKRMPPSTRLPEKMLWYFAPDGAVFQHVEDGFGGAELSGHRGPKGVATSEGGILEVTWSDSKRSRGVLRQVDAGFAWDGAQFIPVRPLKSGTEIIGIFTGQEPLSYSGNRAAMGSTLELRADGTFLWTGVSFLASGGHVTKIILAANGLTTTGRWKANGYTLVLVDGEGRVFRKIACPDPSPGSQSLFFGGTLYQPR